MEYIAFTREDDVAGVELLAPSPAPCDEGARSCLTLWHAVDNIFEEFLGKRIDGGLEK